MFNQAADKSGPEGDSHLTLSISFFSFCPSLSFLSFLYLWFFCPLCYTLSPSLQTGSVYHPVRSIILFGRHMHAYLASLSFYLFFFPIVPSVSFNISSIYLWKTYVPISSSLFPHLSLLQLAWTCSPLHSLLQQICRQWQLQNWLSVTMVSCTCTSPTAHTIHSYSLLHGHATPASDYWPQL